MVNALSIIPLQGRQDQFVLNLFVLMIVLTIREWSLAHSVEDDTKHFVGPQGIKAFSDCIFCRTFFPYNHNNAINHFFEYLHIGQWQNRGGINKNEIVLLT